MKTIFDKHGVEYQIAVVEGEISQRFELRFQSPITKGSLIGYANFIGKNTEIASLADIKIQDEAYIVYPPRGFFRWFKKAKVVRRNFQRRGLGTAFLNYTLETLKSKGCKRVVGRIVELDLAANPNLPNWYSAMGFEVINGVISKEL